MGEEFPATRVSVIRQLSSDDRQVRLRGQKVLAETYWRPIYKYLRFKWHRTPADAEDLTQSFFLRLLDTDFLTDYQPAKGRFRTYLRVALDRFTMNSDREASAQKRGGGLISHLQFNELEDKIQGNSGLVDDPEAYFHREWISSVLESAVRQLQELYRDTPGRIQFEIFKAYDLERFDSSESITYQELAKRYSISPTDVTNYLSKMRREFRRSVLDTIRELTASDEEYRKEVRAVLGIDNR